MEPSELARFWPKMIISPSTCWLWVGATSDTGYGTFRVDGKTKRAHRVSYEHHVGPIPDGLELDHLCRVKACVNPTHLEAVTHAENIRRSDTADANRARFAKITHCPKGHPYAGDNLRVYTDRHGHTRRGCCTCNRDRKRRVH